MDLADLDDGLRRTRLLAQVAASMLILGLVAAPIHLALTDVRAAVLAAIYGPAVLLQLGTIGAVRGGYGRAAAWVYVSSHVAIVAAAVWFLGGIGRMHAAGLVTAPLLAGLILGRRRGLWVAGVCVVLAVALALLEPWRPGALAAVELVDSVVALIILVLQAAVCVHLAVGGMQRALDRARRDERDLVVRADRSAALARFAQRAVTGGSDGTLADEAAELTMAALGREGAAVFLHGSRGLRPIAVAELPDVTTGALPSKGLPDVADAVQFYRGHELPSEWRAWHENILVAVLPGRSRSRGLLAVGATGDWQPTDGEHRFLETIASLLATALEQHELDRTLARSQKLEAVGQLAGGVAHDFNNLLTSILTCSTMLRDDAQDGSETRELAEEIEEAAQRGARLTRQLLAFGRRRPMSPQAVDMDELVQGVERFLRRLIVANVTLQVDVSGTGPVVRADPSGIEQIVANLVVNAVEAMPDGGMVHVATRLETVDILPAQAAGFPRAAPGHHVVLTVSDTGVGMGAETRARLFEPFFTTKTDGSGLGLSTVFGVVAQTRGYITLESAPRSGSTFAVYLPIEDDLAASPGQTHGVPSVGGGTETVLLVEDDERVREVARRVLSRAGYRVMEADDGETALEVLQTHTQIDLVISDVIMRRMHGDELARRLGDSRPRLIFTSGYTGPRGEGAAHGVRVDLPKPFGPSELLTAVRTALDA